MNNQQRAALSVRDAERDAEILRHQRAMVDIDERYNNKVDDLGQSDKSRVALSMRRNNGSNPQQQPSTNDVRDRSSFISESLTSANSVPASLHMATHQRKRR